MNNIFTSREPMAISEKFELIKARATELLQSGIEFSEVIDALMKEFPESNEEIGCAAGVALAEFISEQPFSSR